jgi:DNA replication protein DnaC
LRIRPRWPNFHCTGTLPSLTLWYRKWTRRTSSSWRDLSFTQGAQNVVSIGGPGTGQIHLATTSGISGLPHRGLKVRFYSTVDLVNALVQEKSQGKAGSIAQSLMRMDLVVLDELGYWPFSQAGGALLFHLLSKLYEHAIALNTTNLKFAEWSSVFGDVKMTPRHCWTG